MNFKEWFNETFSLDIDALPVGGKRIKLSALLRKGMANPESLHDFEKFGQILPLFKHLMQMDVIKAAAGTTPWTSEFYQKLYQAFYGRTTTSAPEFEQKPTNALTGV